MNIGDLLTLMMTQGCSDLHLTVGTSPILRKDGKLVKLNDLDKTFGDFPLTGKIIESLAKNITPEDKWSILVKQGEIDFSYSMPGQGRFRINTYRQRGCLSMAIRAIPLEVPSFDRLALPSSLKELCILSNGLILVTGPTGSGKSTTLAALIDLINNQRGCHILTIEDPIEYLHKHNKSIVNQRELGSDTQSFSAALRAALRQDPDVILVGEMRDLETVEIALTAAETGHLVLATLHTNSAVQTIDRIVDVFPADQQQQIKIQLAAVLRGIISQRLLPLIGGGRTAVLEILLANPAIRSLIREGKTHQIYSILQTSSKEGMITLEKGIKELLYQNKITASTALLELPGDEELNAISAVNRDFLSSELI